SGTTSGSVIPLMATALRRIFLKPTALAAAIPARTRSRPSRRAILRKVSRRADRRNLSIKTVAAGDFAKGFFGQRVETNVDPYQAGVFERLRLLLKQDAVGRQSNVV